MKMRVVFSKLGGLKYIGHLDLMRAMQRALRRSGLPLKYSQGFNPHILLTFAAPLSVGVEGLREVMDVPLAEDVTAEAFVEALNGALPQLLRCHMARPVPDDHPAPMAQLFSATYRIEPLVQADTLLAALPGFLSREDIPATRKGKKGMVTFNLRPMVFNMLAREGAMLCTLSLSQDHGTLRPDLLFQALCSHAGIEPPQVRITRTALLDAQFSPLELA